MAINIIQGFNPSTTEPVDSRQLVADQTARYSIATFNAYNGLIVFQQSDSTIWVLVDINNIANGGGWSQVGGGGWIAFSSSVTTATTNVLFSVDPANSTAIYVNYYIEYSTSTLNYPSRTGQIQVTIPRDYSTEQTYYTEQTTERNPSLHNKSTYSINTEQAQFTFTYNGSSQLIESSLYNSSPDYTVAIRGEYKVIAKI